jgi:riboflavin kinase/FMN adenylyltransferase
VSPDRSGAERLTNQAAPSRVAPPPADFPASRRPLADPRTEKSFLVVTDPASPPAGLVGAVVAIGNFDGIHRGHVAVIRRAEALARELGRPCAVLTFEPHPSDYFRGPGTIFRLTPSAAKAKALERLGIDGMIVVTFNATLAGLGAEEFVAEILVRRLEVRAIVAGYDFHFGAGRKGTPDFLRREGERLGFVVEIVPRVPAGGEDADEAASSTATRVALEAGDVERAALWLGHPFVIMGEVVPGNKLGRTLGFPTANVVPDPSCRLRHGIYAVRVDVEGRSYDAVASYGRRPTLDNGPALLEAFLFGFSGNLYGKVIEVAFVAWIRPEEKFSSLDALKAQIAEDCAKAKAILGESKA